MNAPMNPNGLFMGPLIVLSLRLWWVGPLVYPSELLALFVFGAIIGTYICNQ